MAIRRTLAVILAGALLFSIIYLQLGGPADPFPADEGYPYVTSRSCKTCHAEIYAEWESSFHSRSWTDRLVRNTSRDFKDVDCIPCHAPQPVLRLPGFSPAPLAREKLRKEGVSCLSCHRNAEGVAGNKSGSSVPCRAEKDERIGAVGLCKTCHNLHGTVDDWEKTPLKMKGQDCRACHMPPVRRNDGTAGRSHTWQGGHRTDLVAGAVRMDSVFDRQKGLLLVTVENVGAGHNIPTELRHRSLDVEITMKAGYWTATRSVYRFRNPYKEEGLPNAQLRFGEKRVLTFSVPNDSREAQVRLVYRFMHRWEGGESVVIKEQTVSLAR